MDTGPPRVCGPLAERGLMNALLTVFAPVALTLAALSLPVSAANAPLHPPAEVLQSLGQLRAIVSLDGLPAEIRRGDFALPDGKNVGGWAIAEPGASWNATDVVVNPSLPYRRFIVAACSATICVLHYERGGIALTDLVMCLRRKGDGWKATWLAYGHPPAKNLAELRALLENRSTLVYHDDTNAHIDYY
jgi:hypothetical protein